MSRTPLTPLGHSELVFLSSISNNSLHFTLRPGPAFREAWRQSTGEQTPHRSTWRSRPQYPPSNTAGRRGKSRTFFWPLFFPAGIVHESGQQHGWIFSRDPSLAVEYFPPAGSPRKSSSSSHTVVSADQWPPHIQPWGKLQHGSVPCVPVACHAGDSRRHRGFYGRSGLYTTTSAFSSSWIHRRLSNSEETQLALPRLGLPNVAQPYSRPKATLADPPASLDSLSGTRLLLEG